MKRFAMNNEKFDFLTLQLIPLLSALQPATTPKWGKMNAQQMIEHLSDFFKISFSHHKFSVVTDPEHLPKYKAFLLSDKEFRENTKAPVLPEEPFPVRHTSLSAAINELKADIDSFVLYFNDKPNARTIHPVFGDLDFSEWVQLHHKHAIHHLKQFGLL
jgi:oxepin-CoA hydrolase/3-oxo-5,6-dehydrosuberyl-CoA semialdehyde dehydrogenase